VKIYTRTGDDGTTGHFSGERVSKTHPRVEAYGAVDELNAALGLARSTAKEKFLSDTLLEVQKDLVILMGELATGVEDIPRYQKDGFSIVTPQMTAKLETVVRTIESQNITYKGWATPGATPTSAALDLARTTCRRAERRVCALHEASQLSNGEILIFLNRLSDLLWLLARWAERNAETA